MATPHYVLQLARGTTEKNNKYTGKLGELTVDTTSKTLRLHDGKTPGGVVIPNSKVAADAATHAITADKATGDEYGNRISTHYIKIGTSEFATLTTTQSLPANNSSTSVATTAWVNSAASVVHKSGDETINGKKTFNDECTFTKTIQGTAVSALWADLAENYISDFEYPYGTLICFGGEKEVTIATEKVNGVVSRQPALIMNRECIEGLPIALVGRVDVLVKGRVAKFDNIILSDVAGVGVVDNEAPVDLVIGKALQDKEDEVVGTVLCATKFNLL